MAIHNTILPKIEKRFYEGSDNIPINNGNVKYVESIGDDTYWFNEPDEAGFNNSNDNTDDIISFNNNNDSNEKEKSSKNKNEEEVDDDDGESQDNVIQSTDVTATEAESSSASTKTSDTIEINNESFQESNIISPTIDDSVDNINISSDYNSTLSNNTIGVNTSSISSTDVGDGVDGREGMGSYFFIIGSVFCVLAAFTIAAVLYVNKKKLYAKEANQNQNSLTMNFNSYQDIPTTEEQYTEPVIGYTQYIKNNKDNQILKNYQYDVEAMPPQQRVINIDVPEYTYSNNYY